MVRRLIHTWLLLVLLICFLGGVSHAETNQKDVAVLTGELIGLMPSDLRDALESGDMSVVTSSFTATNPATGAIVATISPASGETAHILAYRIGGTTQGYGDLYLGSTRLFNSGFFGDYGDTGWIWCPNWKSLSSATSVSVRIPKAITGDVCATILVGKVR